MKKQITEDEQIAFTEKRVGRVKVVISKDLIYAKLSPMAFTLMIYVISKGKGGKFTVLKACEDLSQSEYLIRKALKELQERGYLYIDRSRSKEGRFNYIYEFYESPSLNQKYTNNK